MEDAYRPVDCTPNFETFEKRYIAGHASVVWAQYIADLETPVSAYAKLTQDKKPFSFLLESVENNHGRGRYSFIGWLPDLIWRCSGDKAEMNTTPHKTPDGFVEDSKPVFESFRSVLAESQIDLPENLPPMSAGLFGYMGFEMVRLIERLPDAKPDSVLSVPDGLYIRPTLVAVFDSLKDILTLVTPVRPQTSISARQAYNAAEKRLSDALIRLEKPRPLEMYGMAEWDMSLLDQEKQKIESSLSRADYEERVKKAQAYIKAGDIFQVVLSQRFQMPFHLPPFALYRALRRTNPSPFLYFLDMDGFSIIGSSPEIMVAVTDRDVTIRPIAGTRPRGKTPAEDQHLATELGTDPKECAEHLMLLDLGRNDVGRVAEIGTVQVTEKYLIERYSHVMHIVSNVKGCLRDDVDAVDAVCAGFPAGTVSGAPKIRAMEIIDELEISRRGIYAGCVGYFGANGTVQTAIVLRTAVVKDNMMYVQAGAGIVADSVPSSEHQECVNKSMALFYAAQEAIRFAKKRN